MIKKRKNIKKKDENLSFKGVLVLVKAYSVRKHINQKGTLYYQMSLENGCLISNEPIQNAIQIKYRKSLDL